MRLFQVTLFLAGMAAMIASAFGIGKSVGETLFNTGIAVLLIDLVCIQLWPAGHIGERSR